MSTTDFSKQFAATIVAKSDQVNADDLIGGPLTVTIREVRVTGEEQPIAIVLDGDKRAFKPCKTMRRLLMAMWGEPASPTAWAGRKLELYRDPSTKWGGVEVGGVRIGGMSHIKRQETIMLQIAKGKKAPFTVVPLPTEQAGRADAPRTDTSKPAERPRSPTWREDATKLAAEFGVSMLDLTAACGGRGQPDWTEDDYPTILRMVTEARAKRAGGAS